MVYFLTTTINTISTSTTKVGVGVSVGLSKSKFDFDRRIWTLFLLWGIN
jgi:hypothetical protein